MKREQQKMRQEIVKMMKALTSKRRSKEDVMLTSRLIKDAIRSNSVHELSSVFTNNVTESREAQKLIAFLRQVMDDLWIHTTFTSDSLSWLAAAHVMQDDERLEGFPSIGFELICIKGRIMISDIRWCLPSGDAIADEWRVDTLEDET
jgi:hypothetical protein